MAEETKKRTNWLIALNERFDTLMEKLGIPENISGEIHNFVEETAREQFKSGNKSDPVYIVNMCTSHVLYICALEIIHYE